MIVRLSGGLGNQMFQYAFGRAVALKKNERLWIDDFAFKRDPQREYALKYYKIEADKLIGIRQSVYNMLFYANRKINFIQRGESKCGLYYEKEEFCFCSVVEQPAKYYEGCWQNERYFESIQGQLRNELSYQGEISSRLQTKIDEISTELAVAVHVRHGDYLLDKNKQIYEVPEVSYYRHAMKYMKQIFPQCIFYFFSDDLVWCKEQFGQEEDCRFMESDKKNTAQEDLHVMQQCKHFIIANSSFSWWAAWLGKKENTVCIAPKNWYKDEEINKKVRNALLKDYVVLENYYDE